MNKIISYKSEEYINLRFSPEHRKWKKEVLTRDNFTCQKCGSTDKPSAHHIKSFIKYPKHRFDINNGITLCIACHIATESYGAGLIGYMKTKGVKPRWPSAEEMKERRERKREREQYYEEYMRNQEERTSKSVAKAKATRERNKLLKEQSVLTDNSPLIK